MAEPRGEPLLTNDILLPTRTQRLIVKDRSALISALSNLSIQYNFQVVAISLYLMDRGSTHTPSYAPAYPRTGAQDALLKASVFAGAIFGQMVMGYLGDLLGRRFAMGVTNFFTFIGALGSATLTWGPPSQLYAILMACRFITGVGIGGKYPLSATMRRESADGSSATGVACSFFWQTPGAMLPYVVALGLLQILGDDDRRDKPTVSMQFRILFGLGAVPAFLVFLLCLAQPDSHAYAQLRKVHGEARAPPPCEARPAPLEADTAHADQESIAPRIAAASRATLDGQATGNANSLFIALRHPEHWRTLIGTGLSWLVFDFVYYGATFNQPQILASIFGHADDPSTNCLQNIAAAAFGLPGVLLAIANLRRLSTKRLQGMGFCVIAGASAFFAVVLGTSLSSVPLDFAAFCLVITALNWGPNVSTYVLPTEAFPVAVRSSFYGASAALGKAGALLGGAFFGYIADSGPGGLAIVFVLCALLSLLGAGITMCFVEPYGTCNDGTGRTRRSATANGSG